MRPTLLLWPIALPFLQGAFAQASDPCAAVAGKQYVAPAAFRACLKSFPYNETLKQNVLTNVARIIDGFFTFEDYYIRSPAPFQESTMDIWGEIARINRTVYKTDYDFNFDLFLTTSRLNDGHTKWYPDCHTSIQNILPAPVVSLAVNGVESLYITPDLLDIIPLLNSTYTDYLASINFNWQRLAGAKVLEIDGKPAYDYVDEVARLVASNYLDHGIRVNSVYTSYRVSGADYSQRLGDLAAPTGLARDSLKFKIQLNNSRPEVVDIPYVANWFGQPFTDSASFWAANCNVQSNTNGFDLKDAGNLRKVNRQPKFPVAQVVEGRYRAVPVPMPASFKPTLTPTNGSSGALRGYILPGSTTGVMFVTTFSPSDFYAFQGHVTAVINDFKAAGVTKLIIDTSNNGGGYVCLGQFLYKYLAGSNHVGNPGFQSSLKASGIAQRTIDSLINLGVDASISYYTGDNYANVTTNQIWDKTFNYAVPPVIEHINEKQSPVSQRFFDTCETAFVEPLPAEPPFALENIVIAGNSWCASTCAMFTTLMFEKLGTKIASFGAKPHEAMEYKGMAGNQVLEWTDLASELKTANMQNDPDYPGDLLVSGGFRVNWRTAYSWIDLSKPIAYRGERARYRFPYTPATYMNPVNLWTFVESQFFKKA
ncbi:hypothetical protein DL96DRAFT_1771318 [Flagelloscypha sp. PMI_526]|nr:hypothetical protein DL96DRAFT_1771318 [Flagelloscypha sp. PMI_526]